MNKKIASVFTVIVLVIVVVIGILYVAGADTRRQAELNTIRYNAYIDTLTCLQGRNPQDC